KGTELTPLFTAGQPAPFRFAGVDAQYFSAVMMPEAGEGLAPILLKDAYGLPVTDAQFIGDDPGRYKNSNITFRLVSGLHELDGGETLKQRFTVFAGPKDPELLARYDLDGIISYGWFGAVSRLLLQVLHGLYWLTGGYSYGLAIVLL